MNVFSQFNFLVLCLGFTLCASTAVAKTCKKYGPNGQVIYYNCSQNKPNKTVSPQWKTETTRENGKVVRKKILIDSVCYNYPTGSIEYRECRRQADDYFAEKCADLERRYKETRSPYNQEYKIDMESFCRAWGGSSFLGH
ncbi:MAG: hypothetical protein SCI25_15945 [Desulfuromonadales bacterium]|nr:hypothetical protein [Desulfuromonadales bacterium]